MATLPPYTAKDLQVRERLWLSDEDGSKQGNEPSREKSFSSWEQKNSSILGSHLSLSASEVQGAAQRAAESFWGLRVAQVIETTLVLH